MNWRCYFNWHNWAYYFNGNRRYCIRCDKVQTNVRYHGRYQVAVGDWMDE